MSDADFFCEALFSERRMANSSRRSPATLPVPRCTLASSQHSQIPLTSETGRA